MKRFRFLILFCLMTLLSILSVSAYVAPELTDSEINQAFIDTIRELINADRARWQKLDGGGGSSRGGGAGRRDWYTTPEKAPTVSTKDDYKVYGEGSTINQSLVDDHSITNIDQGDTKNTYDYSSAYYDQSTNTYLYETTHNNVTTNYYVNQTFNYTNIYYLNDSGGVTVKRYYYKLPDGRNSFDIKASEVAGLSLDYKATTFKNVTVDTHTKLLMHFDKDFTDSSYYKNVPYFTNGATYNYTDSGTDFNECLYFGSGIHSFIAPLGFRVETSDFILQFRIYLSTSPGGISSNIKLGSVTLAEITPSSAISYNFKTVRGNSFSLPVGEWADVAIIRSGNYCTYYLNGLSVATDTSFTYNFSNSLTFELNPNNAYFKLDELRFVDYAVYDRNFVPSPVPYDTNNVLVLPEGVANNTIAVKTRETMTGYRIGGVRPTFPERGMMYMPVAEGEIIDCQVFNGVLWESVGGRLYTDNRWVSLSGFKVVKVGDYIDPSPGDGSSGGSGDTGGGSSGGSIWDKLFGSLSDAVLGFFKALGFIITTIITGLVNLVTTVVSGLSSLVSLAGEFATIIGGIYTWLPSEIQVLIVTGFSVFLTFGVVKAIMR